MLVLLLLFVWVSLAGFAEPRRCVGELKSHTSAAGEDLFQIAKRYHLAVDHLAFANGFPITTTKVKAGTRIIIPSWRILPHNPPKTGLVINLPERQVYVFRDGSFDRSYPLSIGDEVAENGRFRTPTGSYHIIEKIKNPVWYPPS